MEHFLFGLEESSGIRPDEESNPSAGFAFASCGALALVQDLLLPQRD